METLVVYYSRTGKTKKLAYEIAYKLEGDKTGIKCLKKRKGFTGAVKAAWSSFAERKPELKPIEEEIREYDLIIVGTPIWVGNISSPIRTFLLKNRGNFNSIAFFSTFGIIESRKIYDTVKELSGIIPVNALNIRNSEVGKEKTSKKVDGFIKKIKKNMKF